MFTFVSLFLPKFILSERTMLRVYYRMPQGVVCIKFSPGHEKLNPKGNYVKRDFYVSDIYIVFYAHHNPVE